MSSRSMRGRGMSNAKKNAFTPKYNAKAIVVSAEELSLHRASLIAGRARVCYEPSASQNASKTTQEQARRCRDSKGVIYRFLNFLFLLIAKSIQLAKRKSAG